MRRDSSGHPQLFAPVEADDDSLELEPPAAGSPELEPPAAGSPELEPPDAGSPELEPPDAGSPVFVEPLAFFLAEAAEDRRSFLAQPLPLKWIVGGTNARLTRPSHRGHW
jgi:hypothetical protein